MSTYAAAPLHWALPQRAATAEEIVSEVAARPRGGARRAPGKPVEGDLSPQSHWPSWLRPKATLSPAGTLVRDPYASRARRSPDTLLIDAFDAAQFISRRCDFWDVATIIAHSSLASVATQEAQKNIAARRRTEGRRFRCIPRPKVLRALDSELLELHHCSMLLARVQATGVFDGY